VANQKRRPARAAQAARQGTPGRSQRASGQPVSASRRSEGTSKATGTKPASNKAAGNGVAGNRAASNRAAGNKAAGNTVRATSAAGTRQAAQLPANPTPVWLRMAALVLSVAGLGVSIYLTIAHLTSASILVCSSKGVINCLAVTTSPESEIFGIFPVAELGLAFYVLMVVVNSPWFWRPSWAWLPNRAGRIRWAWRLPVLTWRVRLASVVIGILFVLYLIYTELVTLRAICLWCTAVHIVTFLLFVLLIVQATSWGPPAPPGDADRSPVKGASS
jgi:uncharacterized membrane protein